MYKSILKCSIAAVALSLTSMAVHAESYPTKPVRLIVPFPPGGSVDYVARTISQKFSEHLGQTIVVDNRGGASGTIGTAEAARAAPDGYTLLLVFDSHAVNQSLYDIKYDTLKSFDYVSLIGTMPMAVVTSKKSDLTSLAALLAKAKTNPGSVTYGSSGVGGSNHLNPVAFAKKAGIKLMHVPYRGGGPMLTALLGGEVDMVISSLPTVINFGKTGRANIVAIASKDPAPQLPGVPTVDAVLPGYVAQSWVGLVAPANLPREVFQKIQTALAKALAEPDVRKKMTTDGFNIVNSSPAEFEQQVRQEAKRWSDLIREEKIAVE